jgi:hypothetical protein
MLVGDSRMRSLHAHSHVWLGPGALELVSLSQPMHVGLGLLLLQEKVKLRVMRALSQGRVIVLNSLLHDLMYFVGDDPAQSVRAWWDASACGTCRKTAESCGCATKVNVVQRYLQNLRTLAELLADSRALGHAGRVFWVSQHRLTPMSNSTLQRRFFGGSLWQLHDLLFAAEDRAAEILASAGVEHIDLRYHMLAAPPQWWNDDVHYGYNFSLFEHTSMQAILNAVCRS